MKFAAAGKEWTITPNVVTFQRVRTETGVDLFHALQDSLKGLADLLNDPPKLVGVLWSLVGRQHADITPEQFGEGMAGDTLESAATALEDALLFFSPTRTKKSLSLLREKATLTRAALLEKANAELENVDPTSEAEKIWNVSVTSRGARLE